MKQGTAQAAEGDQTTMAQPRPLTQRQLQQRDRVLTTTRQMLAENGYEGLQMRSLAEAAGVSLMTLYNRFSNKNDLILLALEDLLTDLGERADGSGSQGIELVIETFEVVAEQILTTPKYAKAMALLLFNAQPDSPIVATLLNDTVELSRTRIIAMQALGEVGEALDPATLARNLGVCGWSTILLWMKGLISDAEFRKEYRRAPLFVLAAAMTPRARKRYAQELA
ncbi:MAG: helix-turn-helix domain-containing protein [Pseudomonadota bacterium]